MKVRIVRFAFKRFRWLLASLLFKKFLKKKIVSSVESSDEAAEKRSPVAKAIISSVPPRLQKPAKTVLFTAQSVKKVGTATSKTTKVARKKVGKFSEVKSLLKTKMKHLRTEISEAKQQAKADYISVVEGEEAATELWLDVREDYSADQEEADVFEVPDIPMPVRTGRRKARPSRTRQVPRVKRNYRKKPNRWD